MQVFLVILLIIFLIWLVIKVLVTPIAWIGLIIALFGWYQHIQQNRGKLTFKKPTRIIWTGLILSVLLLMVNGLASTPPSNVASNAVADEPTEQIDETDSEETEEEIAAKAEAEALAKAEEEQRIKDEAAAKKKAEEEAQAKAAAEEKQKLENQLAELGLVAASVASVVDGDTVTLSDGNKVRLIGVNTPESTNKTEEYGAEASAYTKKALEGKTVYLQKDVSETDRYGRLLRLVWIDIPSDTMNESEMRTKLFNAKLVLDGYAEPSTYNPDVTYSEYFKNFAREARESSTGLWAIASEGTTKGDFDTVAPVTSTNTSSGGTSSSGSSGSGSTGTSTSTPAESFKNCTAMRAVYPSGVGQDHPAYASKHDRDKDGWACE